MTTTGPLRPVVAILALVALIALVALPVLAADPSGSPSPAASDAPPTTTEEDDGGTQMAERPPKPGKPDKADKAKGEPVTASGTLGARTDADGRVEYTLTNGATVLVLDAGPSWFFGDDHPLKDRVGDRVTVTGEQRPGEDEVDVETVDGVALREPGKPPWAGGWKAVGDRHPGWSPEKAARWEAKRAEQAERHGATCWPPGHCRDAASGQGADLTNPPGD